MPTYNSLITRADVDALVPEEVQATFLKNLEGTSSVLSDFTRVPVGAAQTRFPVLSALPVAYWVTGDTGLKQTSEAAWANKFLNIEELAVIVPIPESVLDDAGFPIWSQVQPLCEVAAGRLIDSAVFFGASAPGTFPTNVVAAATAAGNTYASGTATAAQGGIVEDHNKLISLVEADGYDLRSGAANRSLRGMARAARNTTGDRVGEVAIGPDTVEIDGVIYRFPMRGLWPVPSAGADAIAIPFDPAEFVVGVRQDITWKMLDQAVIQDGAGVIVYNLAQQDMVAMRMVMRLGWQVANTINYDQAVEASRYPAGVLTS